MTTDTSEKGIESLICEALTGAPGDSQQGGAVRERPSSYGAGWVCGDPHDYDREYCVDLATGKRDVREGAAGLEEQVARRPELYYETGGLKSREEADGLGAKGTTV